MTFFLVLTKRKAESWGENAEEAEELEMQWGGGEP